MRVLIVSISYPSDCLIVNDLQSPMVDVANDYSPEKPMRVGNPENDDPSLLLMFQHLKSKSLQTAKGISEVSTKLEFDFVLHNARVFFRMGTYQLSSLNRKNHH